MSQRFFVEEPIKTDACTLSGQEARHVGRVMRAAVGDQLTLFDGSGAEFEGRITAIGRNDVELQILERREINCELPVATILAVSLPKGDRQKWLVEKAVEMGVTKLVPLKTSRSVAQPADKAIERLRRAVIEASKQCERNRLMEIGEPRSWAEYVAEADPTGLRWLAHPAKRLGESQREVQSAKFDQVDTTAGPIQIAVGPEGGFSEDEVAQAIQQGWHLTDLGPRILRIETAALFLASIVASRLSTR